MSSLDPEIYEDPLRFLPERWSSQESKVKHKDAFAPFSMGPFGCIGKNLALMELRLLTTQLVTKFDLRFAEHEDGSRILTETRDHFTVGAGDLDICFTSRAL
jgi:tryprostatin B 6-hydroxylase